MTDQEIVERYKRGRIGVVQIAKDAGTSALRVAWLLGAAGVRLRKQGETFEDSMDAHLSRLRRYRSGATIAAIAAEDGITRQAVHRSVQRAALHVLMEAP